MDIPANRFLQCWHEEEHAKLATVRFTTRPDYTDVVGTSACLVSHTNQEMTLHLAGINCDAEYIPTSRLDIRSDYDHI